MKRRAVLAGIPMALLTAGCTDLVTDGQARFEAQQAVVSEDAQSETGYEEVGIEEQVVEEELPADRRVTVVNVMAEYSRSVDLPFDAGGELARFTVLATPKVTIAGQQMNPVEDMDDEELAEMMQEEYDDIDNVERIDERTTPVLDADADVSVFQAEAQTEGESIDVNLHITQIESGDDFVICVGVHPQDIDEESEIDTLLGGIEHPA